MDKYLPTHPVKDAADRLTLNCAVSGNLIGFLPDGSPLVDFPANPAMLPLPARSFVTVTPSDVGRDIVLLFDEGDLYRPLLIAVATRTSDPGDAISPDST